MSNSVQLHYTSMQIQKVREAAKQCSETFIENLEQNRKEVGKFVDGMEKALEMVDITLKAGDALQTQTHATEVVNRFNSMTAEINDRLAADNVEQIHEICPVFLSKGKDV